jgi:two-component system response regulator FixJ
MSPGTGRRRNTGDDSRPTGAGENEKPIVSVVDDDAAMIDSLRVLLESVGHRVHDYGSARAFLSGFDFASDAAGCIILDERMPGMTGHALHEELVRRGCFTPIIVCTGFAEVELAVDAMRRGAITVIQKPFRPQALLDAVHEALRRDQERLGRSAKRQGFDSRRARLTDRQRQVMALMVLGKPNKAIAADLGISERTVELHRARVLRTMHVDSTTELAFLVALHDGDGNS